MSKPIIIVAIFLIFLSSCSKQTSDTSPALAMVGSEKITFNDLEESLWLDPQYMIRTPVSKARKSQLNHLIQNRYYYFAAKALKMDRAPENKPKIKYIEDQETLKAYIEEKFLDKIKIDDRELIRGTAKMSKRIKVEHMYAATREEAEKLRDQAISAEKPDASSPVLDRNDTANSDDENAGYITFGDLRPDLENAVYSLHAGEISAPVPSGKGFHIFHVLDIKENDGAPASSEFRTEQVKDIILKRKADVQIRSYLEKLSDGQKIQVNNRVLDVLVNNTTSVMGEKYAQPSLLKPPITNSELGSIELGIGDVLDQTLVRFGKNDMSVRQFLERLKEMPPLHRPYLRTRTRMIQSIIDIIRNDLLLTEARHEKVDRQPAVQNSIKKEIRDFLANEFQKEYFSKKSRQNDPSEWNKMNNILIDVQKKEKVEVNQEILFHDVQNPDSVFLPPPIPVMLKNRYVW